MTTLEDLYMTKEPPTLRGVKLVLIYKYPYYHLDGQIIRFKVGLKL